MSDKRQEFVERWLPMIEFKTMLTDTAEGGKEVYLRPTSVLFNQMLAEYDKLKSDKWERLKEFVNRSLWHAQGILDDDWYLGREVELKSILSEMLRLEKEEK
jgi:hypothetical protein